MVMVEMWKSLFPSRGAEPSSSSRCGAFVFLQQLISVRAIISSRSVSSLSASFRVITCW